MHPSDGNDVVNKENNRDSTLAESKSYSLEADPTKPSAVAVFLSTKIPIDASSTKRRAEKLNKPPVPVCQETTYHRETITKLTEEEGRPSQVPLDGFRLLVLGFGNDAFRHDVDDVVCSTFRFGTSEEIKRDCDDDLSAGR
jgi:hypothetical protein